MAGTNEHAADGVLEHGDDSVRFLNTGDREFVLSLQPMIPKGLYELPSTEAGFAAFLKAITSRPWGVPMICLHKGQPGGLAFLQLTQLKNLNAYLVALFKDPASAEGCLAIYLRHAFWGYPLHRVYTHVPVNGATSAHADLYRRTGFTSEGRLIGHMTNEDGPVDIEVLGMLRHELDAWTESRMPALSLR